jgi:hypothetical protein
VYVLHNEALNPDIRGLCFSADLSFASLYICMYVYICIAFFKIILGIILEYFVSRIKSTNLPIWQAVV